MTFPKRSDLVVIGAGQAGLTMSWCLQRGGRDHLVATGGYHAPRIPACASTLPRRVLGLHSHSYRNERGLPPGAVLVVGSAQSGVQIAEELAAAGRRVFLCVGGAGRIPRRYRGRDVFHRLAPDLRASLAAADRFFDERFRTLFDAFIERAGIDAPPDDRVQLHHDPPEADELDLAREGISTVLWTCGYRRDYGWIDLPILDSMDLPRQTRGVSEIPGLYFIGSLWQHDQLSATLVGVELDARALAERMGVVKA